jgi:hypothetical protein
MSDASSTAASGHTRRRFLSRALMTGGGLAAVGLGAGAVSPAYGMKSNFDSPATLTAGAAASPRAARSSGTPTTWQRHS